MTALIIVIGFLAVLLVASIVVMYEADETIRKLQRKTNKLVNLNTNLKQFYTILEEENQELQDKLRSIGE